jgi:hypothetical protein
VSRTRQILIIVLPLLLVAAIELLFRFGAWESLAEPRSHAGRSIEVKRGLLSAPLSTLDFVTLGSSRPEYGLDHERIADAARKHGMMHANLSMPGTHWMTIGVLSEWLEQHHPEIQGGVIALSVQDLAWYGNGYYELGIVQPFRTASEDSWVAAHIPFESSNIESFGSRLALFAWREDIRAFLSDPFSRLNRIRKKSGKDETARLFENSELPGNMCKWEVATLASCDAVEASTESLPGLRSQCSQIRTTLASRQDYARLRLESPKPEFMMRTRELVQGQLRSIQWPRRPIVILMPTARIWRSDANADGLHQWALDVLQPLASDGTIQLIDATEFFDSRGAEECLYFADFYHQSILGRNVFSEWLIPHISDVLYAPAQHPTP